MTRASYLLKWLAGKEAPIRYTIKIDHYPDGRLTFSIEDIANDERSRLSIARTLRKAALALENGKTD